VRWLACFLLVACGKSPAVTDPDANVPVDGEPVDVMHLDKSAGCVGTFGNSLTEGFGRLDGTIVAVLAPGNTTCPRPNDTHLILEVRTGGDVYRMVAAMQSSFGNPDMAVIERPSALVGPAWSDGWHPGIPLDYVADLGLGRNDLVEHAMLDLADVVTAPLEIGARVSVFATVEDSDSSAHLVHRNFAGADGAIVIDPEGSPRYLALRFDNQLF
jgi:hypothetical protein